ncbi:MAG TPA: chemotaxis protein CheB [Puia sp.]|jgi:two-component system CheB/CheR fusion protein|nr:chemotaxis protein CheB [Puia sp.]
MIANNEHYIVAIGASAGGLEAIHEFFDSMPETPNISFIIIQHLSPDYKSLLVELVARHTDMRVNEAGDHQEIERKCVYVIPNTKLITIQKNELRLSDKQHQKIPNNAVDVFLYSLARERKDKAIAIILSGTGTDGTKGTEAIKKEGGLVIVQDPSTAKFDGMPNSVIAAGNADFILPPPAMYTEILQHISPPPAILYGNDIKDEQFLQTVFDLVRQESGIEFQYYKTPTIVRRITKRMMQGSFASPDKYAGFLRQHKEEVRQLGQDFLIGVTHFFRDPEAFDILRNKVIKEIISNKEEDETIKIWVTACSTGEEAYSIAMVVDDVLEKSEKNLTVKIFASDIDEEAIQFASAGAYPASVEKDIPPEYLKRYFTATGKTFTIIPRIRKQIVFARHNIIKDPPFIKNDLVSCRNMLIYISPILQQRIFSLLLFAAGKEGFIFLGPSENSAMLKKDVDEISARWKIYRKTAESKPGSYYQHGLPDNYTSRNQRGGRSGHNKDTRSQSLLWDDFREVLMDDLCYVVLYIDSSFDIRETIGPYEKFLNLPRKQLHLNLLRMIPSGISIVLSAEIRKAEKTGQKTTLRNIRYQKGEETLNVEFFIRPGGRNNSGLTTMIVIREMSAAEPPLNGFPDGNGHNHDDEYVQALESELSDTRNQLQLAIEDLETTNEELQSANEELLSANEELQSSNEELQSLNEELITLNTEHQLKIKELLELNDDLNNYFRSTDIAQVFLDRHLHIRKFNPASARMINFIDSDIGRPLTHISNNIRSENLLNDVQSVLRTGRGMEKEVQLTSGKNLLMRIMPYLTHDGRNDGAIIAFIDITTVTDLNNIIRAVFNSSPSAIYSFQACRGSDGQIADFTVLSANYAANAMAKRMNEDLKGVSLRKDLPQLTDNGLLEKYLDVVHSGKSYHGSVFFGDMGNWYEVTVVKLKDGFVATFINITDRKTAELQLQQVNEALETSNHDLQQFASIASHDLQEPLRKIHMFARAIIDKYDSDMPGDMKNWFEKIVRSTDRMRALIIDILNFSRLSAETSYFRKTDTRNLLNEILEDFEINIREQQACIHIGDLPEIDLIPSQFRQVLHNLFSNALKFTRPGVAPCIRLESVRIQQRSFDSPPDPNGAWYRFTMTDNGTGFEQKFAENIFKLFQRLHPKDRFEGTGIGLAITRKIIDRHNGIIAAHSRVGEGTRFDWVLPIRHPAGIKDHTP